MGDTVAYVHLDKATIMIRNPPFEMGQTHARPNGEVWVLRSRSANDQVAVYDVFTLTADALRFGRLRSNFGAVVPAGVAMNQQSRSGAGHASLNTAVDGLFLAVYEEVRRIAHRPLTAT